MAESLTVTIQGLAQLEAAFAKFPSEASRAVSQGLLAGAVLVEAAAKKAVHSDSNPWGGSSDPRYKAPTGKLQASITTGRAEGSGLNQQVSVGLVSRGGSFVRSSKSGKSRRNAGDVQVYGPIEERRHPFLRPALLDNKDALSRAFWQRFSAALSILRRAA